MESIFYFFGLSEGRICRIKDVKNEKVMHLLHLKHATQRPPSPIYITLKQCPRQREFHWIPSATELKDANITFRKSESTGSIAFEVDFSNGDRLINTGRDVEILSQYGIVKNLTGDNQMAADIINRLAQSAIVSQAYFIYADTFYQINAHHKKRWNRAMAALNRDYFNTPWAYFSFVAAVLLLLLTLVQSVVFV